MAVGTKKRGKDRNPYGRRGCGRGQTPFPYGKVSPGYQVRFIKPEHAAELVNYYHLARTPLSGTGKDTSYERRLLASKWFSEAHPEVSSTGAYKDLEGLLSNTFGNPAGSPGQYRLAQAVLSGTARETGMSKEAAREIVEKTPRRLRSEWSKRNPADDAQSMYETFHGEPSGETVEFEEQEHYHSHLAALGVLVGLKVRTVSGFDVTLSFESSTSQGEEANPGFWKELGRAIRGHSSGMLKFKTLKSELPAHKLSAKLESQGVYNEVVRHRTRVLPTPRYEWEVWVDRGQIRDVLKERARKPNAGDPKLWMETQEAERKYAVAARSGAAEGEVAELKKEYQEAVRRFRQSLKKNPSSSFGGDVESQLTHAATAYDIKQSKKRGYNIYALGHYLRAIEEVMASIHSGVPVRKAVTDKFTGRLLDVMLKAVGEARSTREEQMNPSQGPFGAALSTTEKVTRALTKPFDPVTGTVGKVGGYLDRKLGRVLKNPKPLDEFGNKIPRNYELLSIRQNVRDIRDVQEALKSNGIPSVASLPETNAFGRSTGNYAVWTPKKTYKRAVRIAEKAYFDRYPERLATALEHAGMTEEEFGKRHKPNPELSSFTLLSSNESGTQLFLTGGDQSLDLASLKITGPAADKELITIGELWGLNYQTSKTFDGDSESADYIHILGPKETKPPRGGDLWDDATPPQDSVFGTGELPTLIYDRLNQRLKLSGGIYHIPKPLMGTSPGITN